MKTLLLLSLLFSPAYGNTSSMECNQVREVAEVVLDAPNLSEKDKKNILRNLVGTHGLSCIFERDAND